MRFMRQSQTIKTNFDEKVQLMFEKKIKNATDFYTWYYVQSVKNGKC